MRGIPISLQDSARIRIKWDRKSIDIVNIKIRICCSDISPVTS